MRFILIFTLLFAIITSPCFAQLTRKDVEQIVRQVVREELEPVKLDVAKMKGKIATKDELEAVKLDIAEMKGKMATKDDIITVQRELSSKMLVLTIGLITAWITIIAAIITIPYLYGRADREKVKQLEVDVKELFKLRDEVETWWDNITDPRW